MLKDNPPLEDPIDSISYALGLSIAQNLQQLGVDSIDMVQLTQGIQDALTGSPDMDPQTANEIVGKYLQQKQMQQALVAQKNAHEYMSHHKYAEGVKVTKSGLHYQVIKQGEGAIPKDGDKVRTHYTGKLTNGTIFDSSVQRGTPAEFELDRVIPGWTEALKMMPVGSKWILTIPPDLAYGSRNMGNIPPYSVLIFEIELLDIVQP
ncbi:MAG: FKBP-type peptidyl-prolyl cis-trans isomerase [Flavobacteriales bacterium]|nr:FKBP-type peptidyl-prolyl cis-trans isomerase [Flavobacteriales bacterium]